MVGGRRALLDGVEPKTFRQITAPVTGNATVSIRPTSAPTTRPVRDDAWDAFAFRVGVEGVGVGVTVIPGAAPLLERDGELAALGALLADACGGGGRLVVIEGPAGIGKTRLLEQARVEANGLGLKVLHARGGELERDFGFGVVRQLLEPPLGAAGEDERSELLAGAAGLSQMVFAPPGAGAPAGGDLTHAALHGLYWLMVNLSERSPLLVAVDDVQWADGPSLRFLHHLVRRLEGVPVAVVGCRRSGEPSPEAELLDALVLEAEVIRPAALSDRAVAAVVRGRLGTETGPELCDACHQSSRGNPFLLSELLSELADGQGSSGQLDAATVRRLGPERIAKSVLLRVGRLGPEGRALARAVAVLGEVAALAQAAALAGLQPANAEMLADSLTTLGVFSVGRPLRFVHPVVRAAIYEDIAIGERASMHRHAAELVGDDPEQAAVHLLATDPGADERTVAGLRAAGHAALARGAPESAVRYLRRALAEPPLPKIRPELLGELASAAQRIRAPDALELTREAFELTECQPERAAIGVGLGILLVEMPGGAESAVAVFERSLEGLEDPGLRIVIEALMLWAGHTTAAARALVVRRLREARARIELLPDEQARLLAVPVALDVAVSDGTAAETARWAERALAGGALVRECAADARPFAHVAGAALIYAGELAAAERTFDDVIGQFSAVGLRPAVAAAAAWRGSARYLAGDLAGAEADARFCLEEPAAAEAMIWNSVATATLVSVLVERGRLNEAREALEGFEAKAYDPEALPTLVLRTSRAQLLGAEGEPQAALDELGACERVEREWRLRVGVAPVAWRSPAALCHARLGNDAEARRLAEEELGLARRFGAPRAIGVALRVHALVHDGDETTLAEAAEVLARSGARLEHARALVDLGAAQRRSGQRAAARATLADGADLAHRCGATALVDRAREEQRLAGARPRRIAQSGRASLTPAELRVTELAAQGNTNKQIAQTLFVTLRTVEMHLSNSYRKLDIETRDQLAVALADG